MKQKIILILASLLLTLTALSQPTSFQKGFYNATPPDVNIITGLTLSSFDSSIYLCGNYTLTGNANPYLQKLNWHGDQQWIRYFSEPGFPAQGYRELKYLSNNKILLVRGIADTTISYPGGYLPYYKIGYTLCDTAGNVVWSKTLSDSISFPQTSEYSLLETDSGDFISVFSHNTYDRDTAYSVLLTKIDVAGNVIFRKNYSLNLDNVKDTLFEASRVCEVKNQQLVVCGLTWNFIDEIVNGVLLKIDKNGISLRCKMFDPTVGEIVDIKQLSDDNYLAISNSYDSINTKYNTNLVMLDSNFNIIRLKKIEHIGSSIKTEKIYLRDDKFLLVGFPNVIEVDTSLTALLGAKNYSFGGTYFDTHKSISESGELVFARYSSTYNTSLLIKTDSLLNTSCYSYDVLSFLTLSNRTISATSIVSDSIEDVASIGLINTTNTLQGISPLDTVYCKTFTTYGSSLTKNIQREVRAYPNPVMNTLHFNGLSAEKYTYQIFNALGKMIQNGVLSQSVSTISFSSNKYLRGFYFCMVINQKGEIRTFKLIKN